MKYMLLAYTNRAAWEAATREWAASGEMPAEVAAACQFFAELGGELVASGEFVAAEGLADPAHSRTVRPGGDVPVVTDGPFAESKEVLVSYSIVDCETAERAAEIASRVVAATGDSVEIRPLMNPMGDV
ncbi:YciI family protein [Actinokineospora inagensis]|uniref:YciI family protein n=1 Tax=Actinokineospora inagensis TaxID=103730 RepID=UPI00040F82B6|nr:YciI family protein [Actinokineospora inagensis]